MSTRIITYTIYSLGTFLIVSCFNPFAPTEVDKPISSSGLGDQKTVEGIFQNFKYAYQTKDTAIYGKLLAPNFTFIYKNYDKGGIDVTMGRDEDMFSTAGLFQSSQNLDLVWNDVVQSIGDSLVNDISRGFNLTITFSPQDIVRLQGRVNLRIRRASTQDIWQIETWRDESNF